MKLNNAFEVARPLPEVWAFFKDVPAVADCLPGAEYLGQGEDGAHKGRMSVKLGPVQTAFEGSAQVDYDEAAHAIAAKGKGVDKRGGSRGRMSLDCRLSEAGGGTRVEVDSDIQLSGAIAQFGRTGIVEEIAKVLIDDFVRNAEAQLAPAAEAGAATAAGGDAGEDADAGPHARPARPRAPAHAASSSLSGTSLLWRAFRAWLRGLFGRKG